jgi:hypothetical protein
MNNLTRRFVLLGLTAAASAPAWARPKQKVWAFNSLRKVGKHPVRAEGAPKVIKTPNGKAVQFDGEHDQLFVDEHPLAGASQFTAELIFRPDGGAFEQRLLHLESDESPPVAPGKGSTRMLFEIRVVAQSWYLDAFMIGAGYRVTMMAPDKLFPVGHWYHAAKTYDGQFFRSYVNGELQMEVATPFTAQTAGRASIGARMNGVSHFHGAIQEARFTHDALPPGAFRRMRP